MTRPAQEPTATRLVADMERRLFNIERKLGESFRGFKPDTTFTLAGLIYASSSARYYPPALRQYRSIVVALDVAGTTDTTVVVKLNGVSLGSFTLAANTNLTSARFSQEVGISDYLTVEVTAAGTDAEGLSVMLRT